MTPTTALETMRAAAQLSPSAWPASYPHFRAVGTTCSYVPDEILHAAGFTPVRIRGTGLAVRRADAHLPSYTCSVCRGALDRLLTGELGHLRGIVFAHTCDAMQAMADVCRLNSGAGVWVDTVVYPASLGSAASPAYVRSELARFRDRLARFAGHPVCDEELAASIGLYDETRRLVRALEPYRARLSTADYFAVLDAAQTMPRAVFNPLLAALVADVAARPLRSGGPRLFLSGAVLNHPGLSELIDDLGAQVAGDDLCSGSRRFVGEVGAAGDPLASLADHFLRRPPCPCKMHPTHDPARMLMEHVRETRSDAVLFVIEKYCEPHAFEQRSLHLALDQASIPSQVLEMEQQPNVEGLRTRLQAFLEML